MSSGWYCWIGDSLIKFVLRPLNFRHLLAQHRGVEEIVRVSGLEWTSALLRVDKLPGERLRSLAGVAAEGIHDEAR
jgi:hypothetical protein